MKAMKNTAMVMAVAMMAAASCTVTASACPDEYGSTPVYVYYSTSLMDYLLTSSSEESEQLDFDYWNGTGTYEYYDTLGYAEDYPDATSVPVYRFWNKETCDHFYTMSEAEKDAVINDFETGQDGYQFEGVAFYVPEYGCTPVYRFFDDETFTHLYTTDEYDKETMEEDYQNGWGNWRYEGVAWYF